MFFPRLWLLLVLAIISAGCLGPRRGLFPPNREEPRKTVYVVGHGWHTGVVLRKADIPAGLWPEKDDFPGADYLEVGWGDDAYYRAPKVTPLITMKALFWCDKSVLHVVGFAEPVRAFFPASQIVRVELSEPGFTNLCKFVNDRFKREGGKRATPLQAGLYGRSYFYRATGRYYFPKTCNIWTASTIRAAGCPITPAYGMTARNVMFQARLFADTLP